MPSAVLEVRKLTKRFGGLTAVTDLDFDVFEGEILGVIGQNGAGKRPWWRTIIMTTRMMPNTMRSYLAGSSCVGRLARL